MRIYGIAGKARAGKDTVASWARDHLKAHVDWFAKPIKDAINLMFGLDPRVWDDAAAKEATIPGLGKSPRELAQTLGTEWGRQTVHGDCWVLALQMRLAAAGYPGVVFVPDVRFENEAAMIRNAGGLILHVQRNGADGAVGLRGHASELGVGYVPGDILISNNGTIEDLHSKLRGIFIDCFSPVAA